MIAGAAGMLAANAAVLLGAQALVRRVGVGTPSADAVLFLLLRVLLISAVVVAAGVLHLLTPAALGIGGLVGTGILIAAGEHRRIPRFRWADAGLGWAALGIVVALRLLAQVWFFAPYLGDGLGYHLPKIAEWVRAGGFNGEMGVDFRSTFPAGFELVETWWVVFLHHDVLIEMAGVEFFVLGVAAVAALAEAMGWDRRTGIIAALIFSLNPAFHLQATSAVNDGAATALLLAAAALVVAGASPWTALVPVALGVGVKPTVAYALPGLALLVALLPRGERSGPRASGTLATLAAAALGVGAFWYLRNWAVFGNPIYPMGPGGMRTASSGSLIQRVGPSLQSLRENLACFVDLRVYDASAPPDPLCTATFGWGPAGFALGAVALIPVLRSDVLMRRLAAGLGLAAASIFTLVELDAWNNRFVGFLAVLPALALARVWDRYRFVPLLGGLALLLQFVETAVPGNLPPEQLRTMLSQGWRDRASIPAPAESREGRVAFASDDFGLAYPLYLPSYSRSVIYLREDTTDQLLAHVDREGVNVIYVTGGLPKRGAVFEEAVRRGRLRPVAHGPWKGYAVVPRS
jgi:hypothetical protein